MGVQRSVKIIWFFAILFLAGSIANFAGFLIPVDLPNAEAGLAVALFLFFYGLFFLSQFRKTREFQQWLFKNQDQLRRGGAPYQGTYVRPDTEVIRFETVISFLRISLRVYSRPFLKGQEEERIFWTGTLCTLGALLLGWWEIPSGPVLTVRAILMNLRGGKKETIGDLLNSEIGIPPGGLQKKEQKSRLISD